MKKTIVICIAFFIFAIACHKKAVPVVTTRTEQPEAPASPVHPVYTAADLEAGKAIYETKCARCHTAKPVGNYTAGRWVGILKSMVPKAKLDSTQTAQVTAYVNTNAKTN
jgi:mono/diheme cytochrome c family protein